MKIQEIKDTWIRIVLETKQTATDKELLKYLIDGGLTYQQATYVLSLRK